MSNQYDMIVIGAGISGLSMAWKARQAGLSVLVLEKEAASGGCFQSATVDGEGDPFWLEMGTHTCFNSYGRLLEILKELGLMDQLQGREKLRYRMFVDEKLVSIPSRLNFFELFTHAWRLFSLKKDNRSVADYYGALVGPKNYRNLFNHAFNAVLCQQASDVPADMMFRKRPRDKSVMRSFTFAEGLGRIISELESQLEVRKEQQVTTVRSGELGYEVETEDGLLQCDKLVCAAPVLATSRLLKESFPEVSEHLGWINEVEIESVGIVVKKDDLPLDAVAGIIAVDGDFYSAVSRDYVDHAELRGFTFHFKPGLLDEEQKVGRICSLLNLEPSQLVEVFHKINRLPAPDMGHHPLIAKVDELLEGQSLALVGNYFSGVAVEDCLERVEREFSRLTTSA